MSSRRLASFREMIFIPLGNYLPRLKIFDRLRFIFFRLAGVAINGRCIIFSPVVIRPIGKAFNVEIGRGTFLNAEVRFGVPCDRVTIGADVRIGPRVMFETASHRLKYVQGQRRGVVSAPIVVEDGAWIGAGAIVLPGVRIGRGAVVAAGSVVTRNVEADTVVAGVPARFVKSTNG